MFDLFGTYIEVEFQGVTAIKSWSKLRGLLGNYIAMTHGIQIKVATETLNPDGGCDEHRGDRPQYEVSHDFIVSFFVQHTSSEFVSFKELATQMYRLTSSTSIRFQKPFIRIAEELNAQCGNVHSLVDLVNSLVTSATTSNALNFYWVAVCAHTLDLNFMKPPDMNIDLTVLGSLDAAKGVLMFVSSLLVALLSTAMSDFEFPQVVFSQDSISGMTRVAKSREFAKSCAGLLQ